MSSTTIGKTKDGKDMIAVEITNKNGMKAVSMNYGAILMNLFVPGSDGELTDVVLGFKDVNDYEKNNCFYGCTVARCANRIGGAAFTLNGKLYNLDKNDGNNNLHSGYDTLARKVWDIKETTSNSVTYAYSSPDMEMGFPGAMEISVTYELTESNALKISYKGISNQDTIFNPTNHSYFNLNGQDGSTILDHIVTIDADTFTWADSESIPDGTIKKVFSTPMDFTSPTAIGDRVDKDYDQLKFAGGYDHNYCLNRKITTDEFSSKTSPLYFAARLENADKSRCMEVYTDLPGIQLYVGNYMDPSEVMKNGKNFVKRGGVCLETQYFPNAINVDSFESPILKAGENFESTTVYKFEFH